MLYESTCFELNIDPIYTFEEELKSYIDQAHTLVLTEGIGSALKDLWEKFKAALLRFWNWVTGKTKDEDKARQERAAKCREELDKIHKELKEKASKINKEVKENSKEFAEALKKIADNHSDTYKKALESAANKAENANTVQAEVSVALNTITELEKIDNSIKVPCPDYRYAYKLVDNVLMDICSCFNDNVNYAEPIDEILSKVHEIFKDHNISTRIDDSISLCNYYTKQLLDDSNTVKDSSAKLISRIQSKPTDHDKRMQSSSKAADVSHMMGLSYRLVVSSTGLYHNEIKRLNGLKSAHEETVKSIASQINHAI